MKEVDAYEVKTHLAQLLNEVAKGAHISITRRGKPIAMIVPYQKRSVDAKLAIEELRKWRQGISWGNGMNTRKAIEEGRR